MPLNIIPTQKQPWASKKHYPHQKTTLGIQKSRSPSQERPWESKRDPPSHKQPDIKTTFSRPKNDPVHSKGISPVHRKTLEHPRPNGGHFGCQGSFLERGMCFFGCPWSCLKREMSFLDAHCRFWNGDYTFWMPRVVFGQGMCFLDA